ncbi:FAD:protein FMN transferase (plasmid) [Fulvitalea axinellae]|uniref:FAD:protein FMN transferase n=1 Tax=Fulvitalea axinellae TaxID=1182444 RepID=A0AAU9DE47_9BACT|nr:FAD:protein FMN transferase [Fulvitalea axinellae]
MRLMMFFRISLCLVVFLFVGIHSNAFAQRVFKEKDKLMGCGFEFTVVANDLAEGTEYINIARNEIKRIERLISSWDPSSQTSTINAKAGIEPVKVSVELFDLIERSLKVSNLTGGAFDISYASMDRIWRFDGSMSLMPDKQTVAKSVEKVGYKNIVLNKSEKTVFLKKKGMRIGFGAIGKGYAADRAKALLRKRGVTGGIINASGDLTAWGKQPDGKDWMVAIVNPMNKKKVFSWMPLDGRAVVTSGDYEKFVTLEGKRYSHIIDPRTGYPSHGTVSVTVITRNAEIADALATSIFVMGPKVGLDLVNQLKGIDCIIVDERGKVRASDNLQLNQ